MDLGGGGDDLTLILIYSYHKGFQEACVVPTQGNHSQTVTVLRKEALLTIIVRQQVWPRIYSHSGQALSKEEDDIQPSLSLLPSFKLRNLKKEPYSLLPSCDHQPFPEAHASTSTHYPI